MKIFDVFPFFNELDILEIRLNILDPYVDYFILSEATKTFSGLEKPLFYQENKSRFEKFNHKIIHNIIEDTTLPNLHAYQRDVFQKNNIKNIILNNIKDDDAIIWSDIDEVPNPEAIEDLEDYFEQNAIFHFAQENCMGYLNLVEVSGIICSMTPDWDYIDRSRWLGTKIFGKSILEKYTLSELRSKQKNEKNYRIFPGGWHWSYVGSEGLSVEERVLKKIQCAAHVELNNEQIKKNVSRVKDNRDPLGRDYAVYNIVELNDSYPKYILENKEKYSYLIKDDSN
jgi:beta-1,4-mannosyl-glycoprotein beta-1,4-N-acetylglucosaminyltransferase